jgi:hypothetical protein
MLGTASHSVGSCGQAHCSGVSVKNLRPGEDFWDAEKTIDELAKDGYFDHITASGEMEVDGAAPRSLDSKDHWPAELRAMLDCTETISALGGMTS